MTAGKLYDGLNYFSKLSPNRLWNMFLLRSSYILGIIFKKPYTWGLPEAISIEPTTSCNLRCPECPSGLRSFSRPTGMLQWSIFKNVIDKQKKHLTYLTFYFQGEPYLNPDFLKFVNYASKNKIYTATSTNAHYLDKEKARETVQSGLDRLIISIDGTTQETYENYRIGGDLKKVIAGAKNIVEARKKLKSKTPYIIFQFLVVKPNEHEIEDAKQLAKEIGINEVKFKTAQIYNYKNGSPLIPTIDYYSRYEKSHSGEYKLKSKPKNHCWRMWHSNVVTWDGNVVPCCFDKDAEHIFGSLQKKDIKDVLKGDHAKTFKNQLIKDRNSINICQNCSEGTGVFK